MTFNFVYEPEYYRIIPAVIIDARASIPEIKNQVGSVIKDYTDAKVGMINEQSIPYKIETELGVLAGFFVIQVNLKNKTGILMMQQLRPAFQANEEIPLQIANFIEGGNWKQDYLF